MPQTNNRRVKVLHIITGLNVGGAETMLVKLLTSLRDDFSFHVISLSPLGVLADKIKQLGIPVESLALKADISALLSILKLTKKIKQIQPDVVKTWMYHSDLLGGLCAKLAGVDNIIWGVRHSDFRVKGLKLTTKVVIYLNAFLSKILPKHIVFNSNLSKKLHNQIGYSQKKSIVIGNGFDCSKFSFSSTKRSAIRTDLGLPDKANVVGLIARLDPLKNHKLFFEAANIILNKHDSVYFILSGRGVEHSNCQIRQYFSEVKLKDNFFLLGERSDIDIVMSALDVLCLTSVSESFPNVLGEAMASAVPCVSTDVGDAKDIIGDTGIIVPVNDSNALANAIIQIIFLEKSQLEQKRVAARQRILDHYDIKLVSEHFKKLFNGIVDSENP